MRGRRTIERIRIKKLFGRYSYVLPSIDEDIDTSKFLILYGDNGSGKTTIIKLLYHILATSPESGHKTEIARIPFSSFIVDFSGDFSIWALRGDGQIIGSFELGLSKGGECIGRVFLEANDDFGIGNAASNPKLGGFLDIIDEMNLRPFWISDDRIIYYGYENWNLLKSKRGHDIEQIWGIQDMQSFELSSKGTPEYTAQVLLMQSLERATDWLRAKVRQASSKGESDVNTLYKEILQRIVQKPKEEKEEAHDFAKMIDKIEDLETKSKAFAVLGLMPQFKGNKLVEIIEQTDEPNFPIVSRVLDPFLNSITAKIKAQNSIQELITGLITTLNSFLVDKEVSFDVNRGFRITADKVPLSPLNLSSGERHLLLLFCHSIAAFDSPSLVLVDEPELSLNVKWQRKLLTSLRKVVGNRPIQYVFATHSIEILSKHLDKVAKLKHKEGDSEWFGQGIMSLTE